ncbi:cation-translocating P-type ATPase [Effusibacillus pohliae]|uniref:cation-translocating P-type ATPase n=1 Tax=Effusibacillus pohliae TaxID=232270 RepID=UPI00037767FB|nr:HAD-IC family P-type ATPase [Effusibacillus pohliae]
MELEVRFVRRMPGRLRMYIYGLQNDARSCRLFEEFCLQVPGVRMASAGMVTGRVLVLFDESKLTHAELEQRLLELERLLPQPVRLAAAAKEQFATEGALAVKLDWHCLRPSEILQHLQSDSQNGLTAAEAASRRLYFGANELPEAEAAAWYRTLFRQLFNFTTLAMVSISALPIFFGRIRDTAGVLLILAVNAVIGTYQEQKAQNDIRSLQKLAVHQAKVIRSGEQTEILANELVPGDILLLEAGDRIPADAVVLDSWDLEVDESALTGESLPVAKAAAVSRPDLPVAERKNMLHMGTFITRGRAKAVVVATGEKTEMGKLASGLQTVENRPTPLQRRLNVVARTLVISALLIAGLVVAARFMQGFSLTETLMTGVSVATTAISEGLPIMITLSLVAGMRRMVRHKAVIRRLSALETLAKVDVICCDKTGTLTKNQMTVRSVISPDRTWTVSGDGDRGQGAPDEDLAWLATIAAVCNDASFFHERVDSATRRGNIAGAGSRRAVEGDPTEAALLAAAVQTGVSPEDCRNRWHRLFEIPFDSNRRRMTVVCQNRGGDTFVFMKGSVDVVLERCQFTKIGGAVCELDPRLRTKIIDQEREAAGQAMRVLAVAYKKLQEEPVSLPAEELEADLVFGGMFAMVDPPREDVRNSIAACRKAGIQVVMITGDHPQTAEAIGRELGLVWEPGQVLTGADLANVSDEQLAAASDSVRIYSRVSPTDKQRIVSALQKRGRIVAMTGDGVNDGPALKQADVGIALGSGTDVAKESASLVLMDDRFSTIVQAIRQGRSVLRNIRSTIGYIFTGNFAEVLYAGLTVAVGLPLPLMPLQMMFMNLLTDSLPTMMMILGRPGGRLAAAERPLPAASEVFDKGQIARVIAGGALVGLATSVLFLGATTFTGNPALAGTMALAALCIGKLAQVSYWRKGSGEPGDWRSDSIMIATLGVSLAGLGAAIYLPQLRFAFNSVPLGLHHWALILATVFAAVRLTPRLTETILGSLHRFSGRKSANYQLRPQLSVG